MNSPIDHYRQLAAEALGQAQASSLPQVKMRYLRSAEHFENLVAGLERFAEAKARNEAARAEAAG
jgi:hypothetical protein